MDTVMKLSRPQNYTAQEGARFILDAPHLGVLLGEPPLHHHARHERGNPHSVPAMCVGPGNYFHDPTASALRGAFREIGTQLGNLRLEQ